MKRISGTRVLAGIFIGLVLLFLASPVVVIVVFSFNASSSLAFPITGLTLHWYSNAFTNPLFAQAFHNTLIAAAVTAVVACSLGVPAAFAIARFRPRARAIVSGSLLLPAIVPALLLGIALTIFMNVVGVTLSLATAIVGHVLIALPFVILSMLARLDTFDFALVEAARDTGAGPARAFIDIVLPLVLPSIVGAALLATALSLDEFVVTFFTIGGSAQTLPVLIWGLLRNGIDPTVNALATLILCGTVTLALTANRLTTVRL